MKIRFLSGYDRYMNLLNLMTKTGKVPTQKPNNKIARPQIESIIYQTHGKDKTKGIK